MDRSAPDVPATPPVTQVWLMDGWRIAQHGKLRDVPTGQPRTLLTYLLLQPGHTALRSTLVEELFPDVDADRGRRYLSDALYRLRRALDPAPILADAERISLDTEHAWWVDVWEFYAAASSSDMAQRSAGLESYSSSLAPEIDDHWILVQRVRLQECFMQTALDVAAYAESINDFGRTEAVYRRALAVDPLLESAHRGLMRTLARNGQLAAALEHYDELVDRLEREVAAPPSAETRQLADQLFQELDLARRRAETRIMRRLVGRVEERSRLLGALDQARAGNAGMVILLGEAGIGKSALLRDLAHAADWRGWQIHWGISHDDRSPAPYAPLTSALHDALPAPRAAQLATTLPPIYHDLLARLFSTLQRPSTLPVAAFEPNRLPQALAQLLHALQEIAPLLLLLDNVHWGDPALWGLINELLPLLHHERILLVLCAQPEPLQANPTIWTQLETWDRQGLAHIMALDGLSADALGELASLHQTTQDDAATPSLPPERLAELHTASGGNPLLALEILAAGTPHALLESRPAIATLVTQRLRRLSNDARQAAALAAILGTQIDYEQWESLWQVENPYGSELARQAAELERAEVVQINREGYAFAHDTLHAAALADMDDAARHRRHAAALAMLQATESDPLRLLYHAQGCDDSPSIVRYALCAGEQALAAFAFGRADAHFSLALDYLDDSERKSKNEGERETASQQRYSALYGRIQARHIMAQREGEAADLDAIRTLEVTPQQQANILMRLAEYHITVSEMEAAQAVAEEALAIGNASGGNVLDAAQTAAFHLLIARSARDRSLLQLAQEQLTAAHSIYESTGHAWGVAMTTDILGGLAWDQGDYERSAALHREAADAFEQLGDQVHEAQSLNNLGSAYWELGRYSDARTTHERSILVCRELGNKLSEGDNIDNLGGVAWALGDYALAIRQYRAALDLREQINDLWGVAISLSNLASAYRMQGAYEQALDYSQRSLPLYEQVGRKRGKAYVMEGEGQALLALGRMDAGWARLQEALALRTEIGDRTHLIEIHAVMVRAALTRQDFPSAQAHAAALATLVTPEDRASLRQQAHFALFALAEAQNQAAPKQDAQGQNAQGQNEEAARHLALALLARDEMAAVLPATDRARFLQNVPLNRDLAQAAQRYQHNETVTLGMGKQAKQVAWTLRQASDYLFNDETGRRRHVLGRLMAQAAAQGVTPTHDQLAASLGVSRRTILRDLAALQPAPDPADPYA